MEEYDVSGGAQLLHNLPPFIQKLWEIVNAPDLSHVVGWASDDIIAIRDVHTMEATVLPRYFRHANFSSFKRQLNWYGFSKVQSKESPHELLFQHPKFIRNHPEYLPDIHRRLLIGEEHRLNKSEREHGKNKDAIPAATRRSTRVVKRVDDTEKDHLEYDEGREDIAYEDDNTQYYNHADMESRAVSRVTGREIVPIGTANTALATAESGKVAALEKELKQLRNTVDKQSLGIQWLQQRLMALADEEAARTQTFERTLYLLYRALTQLGTRFELTNHGKTMRIVPPQSASTDSASEGISPMPFEDFKRHITSATWWPSTSVELTRANSFRSVGRAKRPRLEAEPSADGGAAGVASDSPLFAPAMYPVHSFLGDDEAPQQEDTLTPAVTRGSTSIPPLKRVHSLEGVGDDASPPPMHFNMSPADFFEPVELELQSAPQVGDKRARDS